MKPIHLLMPMSGQGTRYRNAGFTEPKPMIPVSGTPMVRRLLRNFPPDWPTHFVLARNHEHTGLPALLKADRPSAHLSYVEPHTLGPGHAILHGLKNIPDGDAVLVSYCDYGMVWDSAQFEELVRSSHCDACVVSYRGFHAHYLSPTQYAYSRLDGERVVEVREKGSFTDDREHEYASSGGYYFKSAALLRHALNYQIEKQMWLHGELYTSLTVEALLRMNPDADVRVFEIQGFFQWGTPEDVVNFEFWERNVRALLETGDKTGLVDQVLMPMAGLGSRFAPMTKLPKPLIPIDGVPMFRAALKTLPRANRTVIVGLHSFADEVGPHLTADLTFIPLASTPSGQALSVEAGLSTLDATKEVIVTACDHGIALLPSAWSRFHEKPDCDAAIFTVQGFPGTDRAPASFSYVVPDTEGPPCAFQLVRRVSVKQPVSTRPSSDHLLVGTFWFRTAKILKDGIEELEGRDVRVNGELYLDSVFECLSDSGHRVRMIPLNGYIGWGDPDSLAEALYWQELFSGRSFRLRPRFPGVPPRA